MPEQIRWTRLSTQRRRIASGRYYRLTAGNLNIRMLDADDDPWLVLLPAGQTRKVGTFVTTWVEAGLGRPRERVRIRVIAEVDAQRSSFGERFYALGVLAPLTRHVP